MITDVINNTGNIELTVVLLLFTNLKHVKQQCKINSECFEGSNYTLNEFVYTSANLIEITHFRALEEINSVDNAAHILKNLLVEIGKRFHAGNNNIKCHIILDLPAEEFPWGMYPSKTLWYICGHNGR